MKEEDIVVSIAQALKEYPRPQYRKGMERPLADYSTRLRRRSGCRENCVAAPIGRFRQSDDPSVRRPWDAALSDVDE